MQHSAGPTMAPITVPAATGEHVLTWPAQGGGWWAGRQRWTWTPGEAEPVEEKARGAIFPTLAAVLAGWVELEAVTA